MLVPIDQLTPHPLNSNVQPPHVREKLKRHIATSGQYPAIVVRELQADVGREGGYQILDGENRWVILRELGHATVKIDNFGPLTDTQAELLLATLNPLRGRDDPNKRATLLDVLRRRFNDDLAKVSHYVPETVRELQVRTEAVQTGPRARRVIDTGDEEAGDRFDTFYCLLDDEMRKVVDGAVRIAQARGNLPGDPMAADASRNLRQDYDRGRALAAICTQYVLAGEVA